MREITKYVAEDGKEFKLKQDCLNHEAAINICRKIGQLKHPQNGDIMSGSIMYAVALAICKAGYDLVERVEQANAA